jgi:hypothetical protein
VKAHHPASHLTVEDRGQPLFDPTEPAHGQRSTNCASLPRRSALLAVCCHLRSRELTYNMHPRIDGLTFPARCPIFKLCLAYSNYVSLPVWLMPEMAKAMTEKEPSDAQADRQSLPRLRPSGSAGAFSPLPMPGAAQLSIPPSSRHVSLL